MRESEQAAVSAAEGSSKDDKGTQVGESKGVEQDLAADTRSQNSGAVSGTGHPAGLEGC